jgi:hypothetical protein
MDRATMIDELDRTTAVAIVGIAARFPSAHDVVELWRLVRGDIIDEQQRAKGVDATVLANADRVKRTGAWRCRRVRRHSLFGVAQRIPQGGTTLWLM